MSKLRLKLGAFEVDYEGSDEFIKDQLPVLLKTLREIGVLGEALKGAEDVDEERGAGRAHKTLSTNTIAHKQQAKTGSDLAKAAAARLGIALNKESFTKKEILAEMRTAKSFYKASFASNIDSYLKTLIGEGTLLLQADDTFALSAGKRAALEQTIA